MSIRLYHMPKTRSTRARWALEELGMPYELIPMDLKAGDQRKPEFLQLNPLGQIPVLVDGSTVVCESGAICLYLADTYAQTLAPPLGERAAYYRWSFFVFGSLEGPLLELFRKVTPEREQAARELLPVRLQMVSDHLQGRAYVTGEQFSAADILLASALSWAQDMGQLTGLPDLQAYVQRCQQRPAYQRAAQ